MRECAARRIRSRPRLQLRLECQCRGQAHLFFPPCGFTEYPGPAHGPTGLIQLAGMAAGIGAIRLDGHQLGRLQAPTTEATANSSGVNSSGMCMRKARAGGRPVSSKPQTAHVPKGGAWRGGGCGVRNSGYCPVPYGPSRSHRGDRRPRGFASLKGRAEPPWD